MRTILVFLAVLLASGGAMAQSCSRPVGPPAVSIPLDIATVTTSGTAVNALSACHAINGGWIVSTVAICVDQFTTAGTVTGTPSTTVCLQPNQPFYLFPSIKAVSVNANSNAAPLAGQGAQ